MTERERESKKNPAEGCQWTFSCFFQMFLHIHRCLVALCIPKLGVSASHMKEHGVFPRVTLHQNVSCMKCGVAQVSALLSATLGPQSFSLSLLWLPHFQMCYGSGSLSSRRFGGFSCVYHLFVCTFSLL